MRSGKDSPMDQNLNPPQVSTSILEAYYDTTTLEDELGHKTVALYEYYPVVNPQCMNTSRVDIARVPPLFLFWHKHVITDEFHLHVLLGAFLNHGKGGGSPSPG